MHCGINIKYFKELRRLHVHFRFFKSRTLMIIFGRLIDSTDIFPLKISPVRNDDENSPEAISPLDLIEDKTLCQIASKLSVAEVTFNLLPALRPGDFRRLRNGVPWTILSEPDYVMYCRFIALASADEVGWGKS